MTESISVDSTLSFLSRAIYQWAIEKGWHDCPNLVLLQSVSPEAKVCPVVCSRCHGTGINPKDNIGEKLMLVVTELSEAMEFSRVTVQSQLHEIITNLDGKPDGFVIKIADAMIRLFHLCGYLKINIGEAVAVKMKYNTNRPYRHGGKLS